MTIYIPDELAAELKAQGDLNVSAVCQAALRAELENRARRTNLEDNMVRHEVWNASRGAKVAFVGKEIAHSEHGVEVTVYLTRRHRIVVHDEDRNFLHEFDTFPQFAKAMADRQEVVQEAHDALNGPQVIELDI